MTLLCPRCRIDLQERPAHELVIHGCVHCGGVWLDPTGVARLNVALSVQTLKAVDAVVGAGEKKPDQTRSIDCPRCAEILIRTAVPKAGVYIDRCPEHGAWYDRDELQAVARALGTVPVPAPVADSQKTPKLPPKQGKKQQGKAAPKQVGQPQAAQPTKPQPQPAPNVSPTTDSAQPNSSTTESTSVVGVVIDIVSVALSFFL